MLACGFAVLANLYPKIDMYREPKGTFNKNLERINAAINKFDDDMDYINSTASEECFPFATLDDVFKSNPSFAHLRESALLQPMRTFRRLVNEPLDDLKAFMKRASKQLVANVGEDLFGQDALDNIKNLKELNLQYLGMILLIPRIIQLLILVFGMFTMSVAVCQMKIIPAIEPRKIVRAFGRVCIFSVIFVLGTQLALYNFLSDFGVPFFRITVRLGLGFIYDLVCDSIMISIWIGMNNEFFFAIPRKKKTVTYSIPGVSDSGNNEQNQII
jgi:hypothetical protein